jgi:predicted phosphodiesterase
MKAVVCSDLHSNLPAFERMLAHVRRKRYDRFICLGDLVGYGAQPNQMLDALRRIERQKTIVRGNHDRVVANGDADGFNGAAKEAAMWTRGRLSSANRNFLARLPQGPIVEGRYLFCHGSPFDEDEYLFDEEDARLIFSKVAAQFIFFGHTHIPLVVEFNPSTDALVVHGMQSSGRVVLRADRRYLINPGSLGQPRDRNPQTSFAIFDDDAGFVTYHRLDYHLERAQAAIREAGLPAILADRLAWGS